MDKFILSQCLFELLRSVFIGHPARLMEHLEDCCVLEKPLVATALLVAKRCVPNGSGGTSE
jgi:hypothetical protein